MHRIIFSCVLLGTSSLVAMDLKKVTPSDRAQLLSSLRQIQYAVNYRDEPKVQAREQSDFLIMHYIAIEKIAKHYGIICPDERNFLWLCNLEEVLKPDGYPNKKGMQALYLKAQELTKEKCSKSS